MDLKNSFNEYGNDNNIEELRNVDYLIIDDLGGENVTAWSRDEVLAAVLTYRSHNICNEYANSYQTIKNNAIKLQKFL